MYGMGRTWPKQVNDILDVSDVSPPTVAEWLKFN